MFIEHKILKIKKTEKITTSSIEEQIANLGLTPLRWAITRVEDDSYIIDCATIKK